MINPPDTKQHTETVKTVETKPSKCIQRAPPMYTESAQPLECAVLIKTQCKLLGK